METHGQTAVQLRQCKEMGDRLIAACAGAALGGIGQMFVPARPRETRWREHALVAAGSGEEADLFDGAKVGQGG